MKTWILASLLVLVGAVSVFWTNAAAGTDELPEYWFSSDPALELLTVTFAAGQRRAKLDYHLYADGNLVIEHASSLPGGEVYSTEQYRLSHDELDALIRELVRGGLHLMTDETQAMANTLALRHLAPDSGTVRVSLFLPHLREPGATDDHPVRTLLTITPGVYRDGDTRWPGTPQFGAIDKLTETLRAYRKQAEEVSE